MATVTEGNRIPLTDAAIRLRERYKKALDLLLTGQIEGGRDVSGRWMVSPESVARYIAAHRGGE